MTVNTEVLLDKLYNLRGSDSEILREMDRQKNKAEETKNKTTEEKGKLQSDIAELKKQREELEEQGERFKEVLQGIHKEDYETVLKRLKIDFDPNSILEKLEKNLPKTIENVEKDTKEAEEKLIKVEEEMNEAITTIEELGIRKDTALANQDKLNEYVEMALSGRMNITRDSITSLLSEFGFDEEEQRETAKLLMFPEDALFAYDEKVSVKDKAGKTISEVIQEAKSYEEEELTIPEEPQEKEEQETAKALKEEEIVKERLIELLKEYGIDYLDYTSEEIEELLENFDEKTMKENLEYLKNKKLNHDILINHVSILYDRDLKEKIELLISAGKEMLDIYLNPSVLVKYDLKQLQAAISSLVANGMDPKDVPLMAY
ncbi:TPA: hypothetical protein IAB95_06930 [Candidatus Ventrenecus avicola]|nr:hypothetical protein [Candidatus Ventrenecus avicola]